MSGEKDKPTPKSIEELLKLIASGETLTETQQKQMKDYKFWKTQPVPRLDETIESEGPINGTLTPADIPDEPFALLDSFEWSELDLESEAEVEELYQLLYEHYVEDRDATFRFKYSHEFFKWGLKPPGWRKEWHVGVRIKETGKLVAFIGAIPITLKLNKSGKLIPSVEINFLCIHKKLRSKRLAPVLIKEITRRVNKADIWQALYTAGIILPSPVSTCRYTHRPINWSKLHDVGFSHLPADKTKSAMAAHYALPNATSTKGLRPMEKKDVQQVFDLFNDFQKKFDIVQIFDLEEFEHWLLGGKSTDEASKVIKTYVVENEAGKITDFFSYYLLPFTVLENADHNELGIAYLYYYASESSGTVQYKQRLTSLMNDALITSKQFNVDVFNCVTSQDNPYFIKDAKFGSGDGFLNYYLFNYKTWPVHGGIDKQTKEVVDDQTSGVGVVML